MAIELRQQLKLTQQLIMTPQLQMAIKLLQLSRLELMDMIRQEMEENPALEEVQEVAEEKDESIQIENFSTKEVKIEEKINNDIDWSNYIDEYNSTGKTYSEIEGKDSPQFESFISNKESLSDHLLWQFLMTSPTKEEETIGSFIIGNLDRDGYLQVSIEEIANLSHCSIKKVEHVLSRMQAFDPIGVCARNLRECLLIQTRHLNLDNSVVTSIIKDHLKHLENKNYKEICKALKISLDEVVAAIKIIKELDPRPGGQFSNEEPQYINPDIYVYKFDDEFVIMLNDDGMPRLRINSLYKKAMKQDKMVPAETKDYINEKIRSATWLIRSIHQRQKTIFKVMESIIKFQHEFFEKGIDYLKPMVLKNVAEDINMHESTISRVTTNKYAFTPQGIFELKYFFNSSINRFNGSAISSASVQEKIRQIIESENSKNPYSDQKIASLLKKINIDIARRTVAKYREALGVLSSSKRKEFS